MTETTAEFMRRRRDEKIRRWQANQAARTAALRDLAAKVNYFTGEKQDARPTDEST